MIDKSTFNLQLEAAKISCRMGCDAITRGDGIPNDIDRHDWVMYNLLGAVESIAIALGELDQVAKTDS